MIQLELYKEILAKALADQEMQITFPNPQINPTEIVALESYRVLQKIKAVLADDSLSENECFLKIEEIICLFESLGSGGGNRHDFG